MVILESEDNGPNLEIYAGRGIKAVTLKQGEQHVFIDHESLRMFISILTGIADVLGLEEKE
jgi:hypothetical protein